jgi:hypothetical protein
MARRSKNDAKQKVEEKEDFLRFVDAVGLKIDEASIKQPPPRAPDIEVHVEGLGTVAFELGDLNRQERRKSMSLMEQSPGLLRSHYEGLPDVRRKAFREKYRGAHISLSVSQTPRLPNDPAPAHSIEQALPNLFEHLQSLPDDYQGDVFHFEHVLTPEGLDRYNRAIAMRDSVDMLGGIYVSRSTADREPSFTAFGGGSVLPLDMNVLSKKLKATYTTDLPIDLVLTVRWGESAHLGELETFQETAIASLSTSPYKRIWLHEQLMGRVHLLAGPSIQQK